MGDVVNHPQHYISENGLQDLKKARWYLERLIGTIEKETK